jgi:hypothetical protein
MFSSNHVWSSYLVVMSWCRIQGCTGHGGLGIQGSSKSIAGTNPGWPNIRWGLPSTEWICLFIFNTLSLLWEWLPTGRRLRGRTRLRDSLYYGPPRLPSSYALVMLCQIVIPWHHVMMKWHNDKVMLSCHFKSSGWHVISLCQVTLSCYVVMSSCYVFMSCCHVLSCHRLIISCHHLMLPCCVMSCCVMS